MTRNTTRAQRQDQGFRRGTDKTGGAERYVVFTALLLRSLPHYEVHVATET